MLTKRPRGTNDFLPEDTAKWQYLEKLLREICQQFGYAELRTPIFEETALFLRPSLPSHPPHSRRRCRDPPPPWSRSWQTAGT